VTESDTPLGRFREFVSKILTVTKEDVQKIEDEARGLASDVLPTTAPSDDEAAT